jgi:hypothetical protein
VAGTDWRPDKMAFVGKGDCTMFVHVSLLLESGKSG